MQKGYSIIELLIVLAIITVIMAIGLPGLNRARIRAHSGAVIADAKTIYTAMKQYQVDNSAYYATLALDTLEPLPSEGRYNGVVTSYLLGRQADAYDSPDDLGVNQEFWMEMTLSLDPSVRILVSDSDDAPLSGGVWLDGVFLFENGVLQKL